MRINTLSSFAEHEVDGEAFLLMREKDFNDEVRKLGVRLKLIERQHKIIEKVCCRS